MKKDIGSYINQMDNKTAGLAWADTMVYFLLAAIAMLFIFFTVSFWQVVPAQGFSIPPQLSLSTVFIAISCVLTIKLKEYKTKEQLTMYRRNVTLIAVAGLLFCVCQFFGWLRLLNILSSGSRNMLLVLLVAHAVHFAVALGLSVYFSVQAQRMKSSADLYIFFLQPRRQSTFKLAFLYWDFLGYLWIVLFVVMQVRLMIQA